MSYKILVIDDEKKLINVVTEYLKLEGFEVFSAEDGIKALKLFYSKRPDFVILDLMLPNISGEKICEEIRSESDVPVLMLTSKSGEEQRIKGLELGADDYVTKPFSPRELVMRVKAILRRTQAVNRSNILSFNDGDLIIDTDNLSVKKRQKEIETTPNEFKILAMLAENPGKTFSRSQLINAALGYDFIGYDRTVDTHIKNLRHKIEDNSKNPEYIKTVYGAGYRFGGGGK